MPQTRWPIAAALAAALLLPLPACGSGGGSSGGGAATTPTSTDIYAPMFGGAESASTAGGASVRLDWSAAEDNAAASSAIVYQVFVAATSGGQNFGAPVFTTAAGATSAVLTGANSPLIAVGQQAFFVVRSVDMTGNADSNTVEVSALPVAPGAVAYVSDTAGGPGTLGSPADPFPTVQAGVAAIEVRAAASCLSMPTPRARTTWKK